MKYDKNNPEHITFSDHEEKNAFLLNRAALLDKFADLIRKEARQSRPRTHSEQEYLRRAGLIYDCCI